MAGEYGNDPSEIDDNYDPNAMDNPYYEEERDDDEILNELLGL